MSGVTRTPYELAPTCRAEQEADEVIARLQTAGFPAFRVGGCVRDRLLGRRVREVDVATGAGPADVKRLFPRTYAVGESFGVVIVHAAASVDIEVASFRQDGRYEDGRRPSSVSSADISLDAERRDFTVNALYYDPVEHMVHDHVGGLEDLRRGLIRAVRDPVERFMEDHLRLLRAVRFNAALGFALEEKTRAAIPPLASRLERISAERVYSELCRMLAGSAPHGAFSLMAELGLLEICLPELAACRGVAQPAEFHPEGDVWRHTLLMLSLMRGANEALAWSVLLHDVGKPPTRTFERGRIRFPGHARVGGELSQTVLRRLHASRRMCESVAAIVGNHMTLIDVARMRPARLRRLLARPTFADELELHRIDCAASHGSMDNYCFLLDEMARLRDEPAIPPGLINGRDLLDLGIEPGPLVGQLLKDVQERQLNGELHDTAAALAWVKQWCRANLKDPDCDS